MNHLKYGVFVALFLGDGFFDFFIGAPLEFVGVELAASVFYPVDFLLVVGAPEVVVNQHSPVFLELDAFADS